MRYLCFKSGFIGLCVLIVGKKLEKSDFQKIFDISIIRSFFMVTHAMARKS